MKYKKFNSMMMIVWIVATLIMVPLLADGVVFVLYLIVSIHVVAAVMVKQLRS
jgi:hypothetical protein